VIVSFFIKQACDDDSDVDDLVSTQNAKYRISKHIVAYLAANWLNHLDEYMLAEREWSVLCNADIFDVVCAGMIDAHEIVVEACPAAVLTDR